MEVSNEKQAIPIADLGVDQLTYFQRQLEQEIAFLTESLKVMISIFRFIFRLVGVVNTSYLSIHRLGGWVLITFQRKVCRYFKVLRTKGAYLIAIDIYFTSKVNGRVRYWLILPCKVV